MEFRFKKTRIAVETLLVVFLGGLAVLIGAPLAQAWDVAPGVHLGIGAALVLGIITSRALLGWRAFLRVDDEGVALYRSRAWRRVFLAWTEIRELVWAGHEDLRVRGAAGTIRITPHFENDAQARSIVLERSEEALRARLLDEWEDRGFVIFHSRIGAVEAHVSYFLALLGMAFFTTMGIAFLFFERFRSCGIVGAVLGAMLVWGFARWRRKASASAGWIALGTEGILIHRLDREIRVRWKEVKSLERSDGALAVVLDSGPSVILPRSVANLHLLGALIRERCSSPPPEPP